MSSSELHIVRSEQENEGKTAGFVRITKEELESRLEAHIAMQGSFGVPIPRFLRRKGNQIPFSKRGLHRLDGRTLTDKQKRILFPHG